MSELVRWSERPFGSSARTRWKVTGTFDGAALALVWEHSAIHSGSVDWHSSLPLLGATCTSETCDYIN